MHLGPQCRFIEIKPIRHERGCACDCLWLPCAVQRALHVRRNPCHLFCFPLKPNRISMKEDVPNCAVHRILRSNPCHSYDPHSRSPPKREWFRDFRYCLSDQKPSDTGISWPIRAFQRYVVCPVQLGIFGRLCASVWKKGYVSRGRIWRLKPRVLEFRNCCVGTRRVESDGSLWEPCVSLA